MKELYKVKVPKHLKIGDPWYFKREEGAELERLTVDEDIPAHFDQARVTLEEYPCDEYPDLMLLDMTLYLSPAKTMDTYLAGQMYKSQTTTEKVIGVDTAQYLLNVDGRDDVIHTGADGAWGVFTKLYHDAAAKQIYDGAIIQLGFSSDLDSMQSMRDRLKYFFEDVEQLEIQAEQTESQGDMKME